MHIGLVSIILIFSLGIQYLIYPIQQVKIKQGITIGF